MRVLYISEVQWLSQISRKHHMVRRFPDAWETLFLSPANATISENSFITRSADGGRVRFRTLPLPKPDAGAGLVRALTPALSLIGSRALLSAARAFRPNVVVCSYIWAAPLVSGLRQLGAPVVYDCNDLHPAFYPACREEAERMFRSLVEAADEVVTSSARLREICGRGVIVGNGVDLGTFRGRFEAPLPEKIAGSPLRDCSDLVTYVGSVDDRVDFGLLDETLRTLSSGTTRVGLICAGRIFDAAGSRADALTVRYPESVFFTGRVAYEDLPAYLSHSSVGIAPFLVNEKTAAINPNKLYMYAAMDQNIVSTPFSEDIRDNEDLIYLASDPAAFATAVKDALGDDERRRAVRKLIAVPNSWDRKAEAFLSVLRRVAKAPRPTR
jgi:glycosyltransferase involved in cell wall biosynthesis